MSQVIVISPQDLQALIQECVRIAVRAEFHNFTHVPEVMREKEAADYLGLSPITLKNYRSRGIGPAYSKNGSAIFYTKKELDSYLQKSKVKICDDYQ